MGLKPPTSYTGCPPSRGTHQDFADQPSLLSLEPSTQKTMKWTRMGHGIKQMEVGSTQNCLAARKASKEGCFLFFLSEVVPYMKSSCVFVHFVFIVHGGWCSAFRNHQIGPAETILNFLAERPILQSATIKNQVKQYNM